MRLYHPYRQTLSLMPGLTLSLVHETYRETHRKAT
jgi:hypothetical protein